MNKLDQIEQELGKKLPFSRKFSGDEFAGCRAAEAWLMSIGYSVGAMQRDDPIGVFRGEADIGKWRNLDREDKKALDGVIVCNKRNGPVTVRLVDPQKE